MRGLAIESSWSRTRLAFRHARGILKVVPHESHVEFQVRWDDGHVSEIRPSGASYRILAKAKGAKG